MMIAILIGQQHDHHKKQREFLSVKTQGGHIYRDNLGQQFAVFAQQPQQIAPTAKVVELPQIPQDWLRMS